MTFTEVFTGKGIQPRKYRRLGYASAVCGLLIMLSVHLIYTPFVWRASWGTGVTKEESAELTSQAKASHPEAAMLLQISFALVSIGSLIALKNRYYDYVGTRVQLVYLFMVVWTLSLFIFHPPDEPLFASNTIIYNRLSPGVLALMPFMLLSVNPRIWPYFQRFLLYMCWFATSMGILGILLSEEAGRDAAYRWVWAASLVLEMTALFPIILLNSNKTILKLAAILPLSVLFLLDILMQTRGGFIILAVFAVVYMLMRRENDTRKSNRKQRVMYSILTATLAGLIFFVMPDVGNEGLVGGSYNALSDRIDADTRSGQWENFGEALKKNGDVYLWGKGHITSEDQFGGGGGEGIDSGYMNILWVGGLPLLFAYILFSSFDVIQAFFKRLNINDIIVVALAMGFIFRMASSTTAAYQPQYMLFLVLLGRIIFINNGGKKRKSRRKRTKKHV